VRFQNSGGNAGIRPPVENVSRVAGDSRPGFSGLAEDDSYFVQVLLLRIRHQVKKQSIKSFPGGVLWCKGKYDITFLAAYGLEAGLETAAICRAIA
jgi:hypothetical protein